jgi:hypothetical protein
MVRARPKALALKRVLIMRDLRLWGMSPAWAGGAHTNDDPLIGSCQAATCPIRGFNPQNHAAQSSLLGRRLNSLIPDLRVLFARRRRLEALVGLVFLRGLGGKAVSSNRARSFSRHSATLRP